MTTSPRYYYTNQHSVTRYAKPVGSSSTPSWDADIVTVTRTGSTDEYTFTGDDDTAYALYEQAGAEPAASDQAVWTWEKVVATAADVDEILDAVGEIETVVTIPEIIAANVADESTEDLVRYRGTLWTIAIEELAAIPDKCYFTLKRGGEPDARAAAQILKTNPSDSGNDGLKILMGATAANRAHGSITYASYSTADGTRYRATASILAEASVRFPVAAYRFDFKDVATDTVLGSKNVKAIDPVTLATS